MFPLVIICGPTATGKTKLGIHLANKFNGEIISADSRQVYRGMDVGTGKGLSTTKNQRLEIKINNQIFTLYDLEGVKIWGYDLVEPDQEFSVAHFHHFAAQAISDIRSREKTPIIVGGTGLYLKSLTQSIETINVPMDRNLRSQLESLTTSELQQRLQQLNPQKVKSMNNSDQNNPRRLIRAIEVAEFKKQTLKKTNLPRCPQASTSGACLPVGTVDTSSHLGNITVANEINIWIGLTASIELLDEKVTANVLSRSQELDHEIKLLVNRFPDFWSLPAATATGYHQWHQYLEGKINQNTAIKLWVIAEKQYLRRQLTWFKKQPQINWFQINQTNFEVDIEAKVEAWYSRFNCKQTLPHID